MKNADIGLMAVDGNPEALDEETRSMMPKGLSLGGNHNYTRVFDFPEGEDVTLEIETTDWERRALSFFRAGPKRAGRFRCGPAFFQRGTY